MSVKLDRLYEFAKRLGFTETGPLWETTTSLEVMPDFRIFPNTVRDIKAEVDARIAELTAEMGRYKADAERLDWLEANADHGSMPYYEDGKFNVTWLSRQAEGVCTSQFNTLREAIDFARNALKDGV